MNRFLVIVCFFGVLETVAGNFTIQLLHMGNLHARVEKELFDEQDQPYGISRIIHFVKTQQKESNVPTFFFDTLDCFSGSVWFTVYRGKICSTFLNLAPINAHGIGDSEVKYGKKNEVVSNFANFLNSLNNPVLCVNCDISKEPRFKRLKKSIELKVSENITIGVIGYIAKNLLTKYPGKMVIKDEKTSIREEVNKLKAKGINVIILLSHASHRDEIKLIQLIEDVSLVIGGHSRILFYNGKPPRRNIVISGPYPQLCKDARGKKVPLLHSGSFGQFVGQLYATFDEHGHLVEYKGNSVLMDTNMPEDEGSLNLLEKLRPAVSKAMSKGLTPTWVFLNSTCRFGECNLGNLVADAFVNYNTLRYKHDEYWTDVAIGFVNAASLSSDIDLHLKKNANITLANVQAVFPVEQFLHKIDLKGKVLRKVFEHAVTDVMDGYAPYLLQVSGLIISYNLSKNEEDRIVSIKARCAKCDIPRYKDVANDETYTVVLNELLLQGVDGFTMLEKEVYNAVQLHIVDSDVVEQYIQRQTTIQASREERIIFV